MRGAWTDDVAEVESLSSKNWDVNIFVVIDVFTKYTLVKL